MKIEISKKDSAINSFKEKVERFEVSVSERDAKIEDLRTEIANLALQLKSNSLVEETIKASLQRESFAVLDLEETIKDLSIQLKTSREELEVIPQVLI